MAEFQQIIKVALAVSTFALVLSLWVGAVLMWAARRAAVTGKVKRRLGLGAKVQGEKTLHLWHDGRDVSTTVPLRSPGRSWLLSIERQLKRADLPLTLTQAITLMIGVVLISFAFMYVLTGNLVLGAGVAIGVFVILRIYLSARVARRTSIFEEQLMDAMELAARSLRAGHPLMGAFQLLAEEMSPPVSTVFAEICQRHGMGGDLEQVLREAGDESASPDMKLFATSVAIQIRTGGNLADLMERLALVIRDRMRVHRRARVLTAQTQMSKRILIGLPFVLFVVLNVVNPAYMQPFYKETAAQIMLGVGAVLLVIGTWMMNRMAVIRY
jgi:tight adherence protein B